jgi:hypothetical protein
MTGTRRTILKMSSGLAAAAISGMLERAGAATRNSRKVSVESWMNQWMREGERGPDGTLHLSRFRDPIYFLLKPIGWNPEGAQIGKFPAISVPQGFVTDFASIPSVFWSVLRPDGDYTYPAIVHDYMYWRQEHPREVADQLLRIGMQEFDLDNATVMAIYSGVRAGGSLAWNANAREKRAGGKRILIKYPEDPRVTWKDWRKRGDVFGQE